jgi:enhancer of mRNA-decapping protein 3
LCALSDKCLGDISIIEGEPLEVRAKHVVCLGAPRSGLLRALQNAAAAGREPEWTIWVVYLGLNRPWKKSGVAAVGAAAGAAAGRAYGVPFGGEWVVQVRFVDAAAEEAERGR